MKDNFHLMGNTLGDKQKCVQRQVRVTKGAKGAAMNGTTSKRNNKSHEKEKKFINYRIISESRTYFPLPYEARRGKAVFVIRKIVMQKNFFFSPGGKVNGERNLNVEVVVTSMSHSFPHRIFAQIKPER